MKLLVETCPSTRRGYWVWRVRDDAGGETCLAVGVRVATEEDARRIGQQVANALKPIFTLPANSENHEVLKS